MLNASSHHCYQIPRLITQLQLKRQSTLNGARGVKTESSEASEVARALFENYNVF